VTLTYCDTVVAGFKKGLQFGTLIIFSYRLVLLTSGAMNTE